MRLRNKADLLLPIPSSSDAGSLLPRYMPDLLQVCIFLEGIVPLELLSVCSG